MRAKRPKQSRSGRGRCDHRRAAGGVPAAWARAREQNSAMEAAGSPAQACSRTDGSPRRGDRAGPPPPAHPRSACVATRHRGCRFTAPHRHESRHRRAQARGCRGGTPAVANQAEAATLQRLRGSSGSMGTGEVKPVLLGAPRHVAREHGAIFVRAWVPGRGSSPGVPTGCAGHGWPGVQTQISTRPSTKNAAGARLGWGEPRTGGAVVMRCAHSASS